MPIERDDREERIARIDMLLEELRLNTDDLHELAKQAKLQTLIQKPDPRYGQAAPKPRPKAVPKRKSKPTPKPRAQS